MKKLILAGGSGYLGTVLGLYFREKAEELVVLSRHPKPAEGNRRYVVWDGRTAGAWTTELDGADAVVNLTGRSVNCRYTDRNRAEIIRSRVDSTAILGEAIRRAARPPAVWVNLSTATLYRHAEDRDMDEATGETGAGFSVDVAQRWEEAFWKAETPATRRVALRTAIVLGPTEGALLRLRTLVRFGLGGAQGRGSQFVSWLHEQDFARLVDWVLQNSAATGIYNAAAPGPVTNDYLMRTLRHQMRMPFGLPAPRWLLELGAQLIGTETELILKSRRVVSTRLRDEGFAFNFPTLQRALA